MGKIRNVKSNLKAQWHGKLSMVFDPHYGVGRTLWIYDLQAESFRFCGNEGDFEFVLLNAMDGGTVAQELLPALKERLNMLTKGGHFPSADVINYTYGASSHLYPKGSTVRAHFTGGKKRASDILVMRFLELATTLRFESEGPWPMADMQRIYEPYVGKVPLGEYLAHKYYPEKLSR